MSSPQPPQRPDEAEQQALNPHRREEQARAAEHTRSLLAQRGVRLREGDDAEALVDLLDAVERFEQVVQARGGDSFLNNPRSSEPENPAFVVPPREEGEDARAYARRVLAAAERLRG
ncbi:MAG TPA: hypothetical protein VFS40_05770 [Gemmatimonadales bacterium]|nr:hypothetical protein [Gemmatimonadales bacterium]